MRHTGLLYDHAEVVSARVDGGAPIEVCVSRLPPLADVASGSRRARHRIVLLHGNPANMHDFGPLAACLRSEFEVLALDLPGFGRSQGLPTATRESILHSYARHVRAALVSAGWTHGYQVVGHSHGAAVAQTLAVLYPEEVSGLVLLAAVGTPAHWGYRQLAIPGVIHALRVLARAMQLRSPWAARRRLVRAIMTPIFAPHPVPEEWLDVQLAVVERRPEILVNMALVASDDPCAQLGRAAMHIRMPVLFVHGDCDRLVPDLYARAIYERMPSAGDRTFHTLEGAGHMLQISHAEQIASLLLAWTQRPTHPQVSIEAPERASEP